MSLSWFSKTSYRSHAATTSLYLDNWRLMTGCLLFDVGSIDIKGNLAWTEGVGMDPFLVTAVFFRWQWAAHTDPE